MEYKHNNFTNYLKENDGIFYGYASIFNVVDSYNDIIINKAFENSLKNKDKIKLCWQHNRNKVIGDFTTIKEDNLGLYVEGRIDVKNNQNIYSLVKNNFINGLSIGYMVDNSYIDKKGRRVLTKINLKEISIVSFPANKHSNIIYCKSSNYIDICNKHLNRLINIFI